MLATIGGVNCYFVLVVLFFVNPRRDHQHAPHMLERHDTGQRSRVELYLESLLARYPGAPAELSGGLGGAVRTAAPVLR